MSHHDHKDPAGRAQAAGRGTQHAARDAGDPVPGKSTLVQRLSPVIPAASSSGSDTHEQATPHLHSAVAGGISGTPRPLPFGDHIQRAFGRHDISNVQAHTDAPAAASAHAIGAQAFATGNHVAFASSPDLHTAAHEAAHVVQQRGGIQLKGGVGEAGDAHEQHANQVADRVLAGRSAEDLLDHYAGGTASTVPSSISQSPSSVQRQPAHVPTSPQTSPTTTPANPSPTTDSPAEHAGHAFPVEHGSHKIKVELGQGSVTGAITLSLEVGQTGLPMGDQVKAFKNTASLKLNGFIMKLETAVLNGKLEDEVLDGVKVAVEVSALKASSDGSSATLDLLTVALKLQGDVGHWLGAGPNVKLALEGQVQVALGGKLASKLASYTVAQLDRQMLAKEIETVGEVVTKHVEAIESLEARLTKLKANPSAVRREIQAIEEEIFRHRIQVSTGGQQLKRLSHQLTEAKNRANTALRRLEGKLAKKVARAMEKKAVKFVAKALSKLVPVLNVASTIADVIELVSIVKALIQGHVDGGSGDDEGTQDGAGATGAAGPGDPGQATAPNSNEQNHGQQEPSAKAPAQNDGGGSGNAADRTSPAKVDPKQLAEVRKALSPNARAVIDAVLHKGASGVELDPDQLRMAGLLVPETLTSDEVHEIVSTLQNGGTKARTPEDAIGAIDQAVRDVRNKKRIVTVDGVSRPSLAQQTSEAPEGVSRADHTQQATVAGGPITSPRQVDGGPITSPRQVDDRSNSSAGAYDETLAIVRAAPAHVIGRWFRAQDRELVLSEAGSDWRARHVNTKVGGQILQDAQHSVENGNEGHWCLKLVFSLKTATGRQLIEHNFFVIRGGEPRVPTGAKVGELVFEPYVMHYVQ